MTLLIDKWDNFERIISPFLQKLDPSLLQNVVLGMLALMVPVGVGILSFFFEERSRGKIESNLELFVLLRQVLKVKHIVLFSICSLFLMSLYNLHLFFQIISIVFFGFYIIWMVLLPFRNILEWFLKNTKEFALNFLKNISVRKDSKLLLDAWQALWIGGGSKENEREYTNIFISHIDNALKYGKLNLAIQLSQTYVSNIDKRDRFSIGFEILPKILEWNEILWNKEQSWLTTYDWDKKIKKIFSEKNFPTFQKIALHIFKRIYKIEDSFWNWNYFEQEFFKNVIVILLNNDHYQLLTHFKKHIDECENKLGKIDLEKEKQKYWYYIKGVFKVFCTNYFDNINKAQSKYIIWEHDFPNEWKISESNFQNNSSRIIFNEFLSWSEDRIFKKADKDGYNDDLTEVVNGLFPNVHPAYFPDFMMLFFSYSTKDALDKQLNFFIMGSSISWSGEKNDDEITEMFRQNELSRREETINIILKYFSGWRYIKLFKEDLSENENLKWKELSQKEREEIIKTIRKKKLNNLREELSSKEIKEYCNESEIKEKTRTEFISLMDLLIDKISEKV